MYRWSGVSGVDTGSFETGYSSGFDTTTEYTMQNVDNLHLLAELP